MPDVSQIMVRLRDMVDGVKPNPEWPSDIRALLDEVKRHEREYLELREAHDQKAARATAAEAKLAEVETKERLTYGQWGLTVKLYEQTKASLATATEALREAIEFADQDAQALTPAGERMIARWRTALATIEAGTVEHPDSTGSNND